MKCMIAVAFIITIGLRSSYAFAIDKPASKDPMTGGDHSLIQASQMEWKAGPPSLPKGTTMAVIEGDMKKEGPFTTRFRFPAGSRIPPHFHPAIEHVTVMSGTFAMAHGDKWDDKALTPISAGGFVVMNKGVKHFAMSKEASEVQLHGMGPWGITYVNPEDDPSRKLATDKK